MSFKKLIYIFSALFIISIVSFSINISTFAVSKKHTHIYSNYKTYTCKTCGYTVKKPTLRKVNKTYYYYKNGKLDLSETLVKYNNKCYHVKGGKTTKETTLVKYNNKLYPQQNQIHPTFSLVNIYLK